MWVITHSWKRRHGKRYGLIGNMQMMFAGSTESVWPLGMVLLIDAEEACGWLRTGEQWVRAEG